MRGNARPRFQRKPKDWLWVPNVLTSTTVGTTPLFVGLVLGSDWSQGGVGGAVKDRATYYGTKGTISIAPSGNATSIFLAIGKDIASTFDPAAEPDYVSEGDVFWSHCVRWAAGSTEPIRIEVNIKARRVLQTSGDDAVELVFTGGNAASGVLVSSLHSLVNRA